MLKSNTTALFALFGAIPMAPAPVNPTTGTLSAMVDSFRSAKLGACDQKNLETMTAVTRALENRKPGDVDHELGKSKKLKKFGALWTYESETAATQPKPGWTSFSYGWNNIARMFRQAQKSADSRLWIAVDFYARSVLFDDAPRIDGRRSYRVGHTNLSEFRDASENLSAAMAKLDQFKLPSFSPAVNRFVSEDQNYAFLLKETKYPLNLEDPRNMAFNFVLPGLLQALREEISYWDEPKNPLVRRVGNELLLPLYLPAEIAPAKEWIRAGVEKAWRSEKLRLKIEWKESPHDAYAFVLDDSLGRDYVDRPNRTIHLSSVVNARQIAHEIGHVLGLSDHYFTVWNPQKCTYAQESRADDLMSDPEQGGVTSEEWATLQKFYP